MIPPLHPEVLKKTRWNFLEVVGRTEFQGERDGRGYINARGVGWCRGGQAPSQYSACIVVAYIGDYRFPGTQRSSKHTYVIECEGFHYPVRHSAVAGAIEDGATRRRIQKAGPPRLM